MHIQISWGGGALKYTNASVPPQIYQIRISGSGVHILVIFKLPLLSQYGPHGGEQWCYGVMLVINALITMLDTATSQKGLTPHLVSEKGLTPQLVSQVQHFSLFGINS